MASSVLVVKVLWCLKGAGLQIKNQWRDLKSARIFQKVFAVKNRQKFPKQEVKTFTNCDTCQWDALKNGVKLLVWAFTPFSHFYIICKRLKKKSLSLHLFWVTLLSRQVVFHQHQHQLCSQFHTVKFDSCTAQLQSPVSRTEACVFLDGTR